MGGGGVAAPPPFDIKKRKEGCVGLVLGISNDDDDGDKGGLRAKRRFLACLRRKQSLLNQIGRGWGGVGGGKKAPLYRATRETF